MYSVEKAKEALELLKSIDIKDIEAIDSDNCYYEAIKSHIEELSNKNTAESYLDLAIRSLALYIQTAE